MADGENRGEKIIDPREDINAAWAQADKRIADVRSTTLAERSADDATPDEMRATTDELEQIVGGVQDGNRRAARQELARRSDAVIGRSDGQKYNSSAPLPPRK